jgi:hypothetical protein
VTSDAWLELCERHSRVGYGALSSDERVWLNIRGLIDSIENGGAISYFYNSYANDWDDCLLSLNRLGADQVSAQIERVCTLFPSTVPADQEHRNRIIDSWPEVGVEADRIGHVLAEVDETLVPLMEDLERRLTRHLEQSGRAT